MTNYSILMFIFSVLIILAGIHIYRGHDDLLGRGYYKKESKAYLKRLGKITIIIGLSPLLSGISAIIINNDNSIIPIIVLILSIILGFILSIKYINKE